MRRMYSDKQIKALASGGQEWIEVAKKTTSVDVEYGKTYLVVKKGQSASALVIHAAKLPQDLFTGIKFKLPYTPSSGGPGEYVEEITYGYWGGQTIQSIGEVDVYVLK